MSDSEARPYSYDEVIYPSRAVWYSHPGHMATLAHLMGLEPPEVETCRVLELGAGTGGNLIPMAAHLPRGRFVGVDLSERQVAAGRALVEKLGLDNIELHRADIRDLGADFETFDYIICHGVYSWVPANVQARILAVCQDHLTPNGLAAISYNVLPGWQIKAAIHHLLQLNDDLSLPAQSRIERAVQELRDLKVYLEEISDPRSLWVRTELNSFNQLDQSYFFHEYLETVNEPIYFDQFAGDAERAGLRFIGNLQGSNARYAHWAPGTPELDEAEVVREEAIRDIRQWRRFRSTLLGLAGQEPSRTVAPERLFPLLVSMRVDDRKLTVDMVADGPMTIIGHDQKPHVLRYGLEKVARALLNASPAAVPFEELYALLPEEAEGKPWTRRRFGERLLGLYFGYAVNLHLRAPRVANEVSERPTAHLLTRLEAQNDEWVTNTWHTRVKLNTVQRVVMQFLDGQRDPQAIADAIRQQLENGELSLNPPDTPAEKILGVIPAILKEYVKLGLLVA